LSGLHALRAGWVKPVERKTVFAIEKPASEPRDSLRDPNTLGYPAKDDARYDGRSESNQYQDNHCGAGDEPAVGDGKLIHLASVTDSD
jgi:hypothetical protein